jgi:3-hydroxy-3-methylglutaryl CoA synthase
VSYGSGAGSDAFLWKTTKEISTFHIKQKELGYTIVNQLQKTTDITYTEYLKHTHKL